MKTRMIIPFLLAFESFILCAAPRLTIYDDGLSCPANCDSHVVMHPSLNGTKFAHRPNAQMEIFEPCTINSACVICLDGEAKECLVTPYRGSGPGENTFDLTPAFYEEWCSKENIPTALKEKCTQLKLTAIRLSGRINCIKDQSHELCVHLMEKALLAKSADIPLYDQCKKIGQAAFNKDRPAEQKRQHNCAYEFESTGGPNSRGLTWKKLKPGACREGTFVGRDGLDCCSGVEFIDASFRTECKGFYPLNVVVSDRKNNG